MAHEPLVAIGVRLKKSDLDFVKELAEEAGVGHTTYLRRLIAQRIADLRHQDSLSALKAGDITDRKTGEPILPTGKKSFFGKLFGR